MPNKEPVTPDLGERVTSWMPILHEELEGGSDRACVISACAIVDHLLAQIIKKFLLPHPKKGRNKNQDPLFDGTNPPLGSFSSRIDMAFRLGIIGHQLSEELHRLRKIRNEFAHKFESVDLGEQKYLNKVNDIISSLKLEEKASALFGSPYDTARGRFIMCILLIVTYLEHTSGQPSSLKRCIHDGVFDMRVEDSSCEGG